ncbi:DUF4405 domain-containing protein [Desulfovibrio sp. OttesenSCG-928-I05]|nr:DUF4405 domain-containing protein [Desulfovibrio sp. OttesenSCG-928-I05]
MIRRTISLLTTVSFLVLIISSVVLYVLPKGAGVNVLGLTVLQWKDIHITGGFLFIAAGMWHMLLNYRALLAYTRKSFSFSWKAAAPAVLALSLSVAIYGATLARVAPVEQLLSWNKPAHMTGGGMGWGAKDGSGRGQGYQAAHSE